MSFNAVDWAFDQDTGDSSSKLVLLALARHANEQHQCWPSLSRISKITNLSSSTVKRKIKELEDKGFINHKRRRTDDGKPTSNFYQICIWVTVNHTIGHGDPLISNRITNSNISSFMGHGEPYENWDDIGKKVLEKWR